MVHAIGTLLMTILAMQLAVRSKLKVAFKVCWWLQAVDAKIHPYVSTLPDWPCFCNLI